MSIVRIMMWYVTLCSLAEIDFRRNLLFLFSAMKMSAAGFPKEIKIQLHVPDNRNIHSRRRLEFHVCCSEDTNRSDR
jgi:hypothetical protein